MKESEVVEYIRKYEILNTILLVDNFGSWIKLFPLVVPAGISPVVAYFSDSIIVCKECKAGMWNH